VVSLAVMAPAVWAYEPGTVLRFQRASLSALGSMIAVGLFSLALSMILYFRVLQQVDAMQASVSIYMMPAFGVLLSALTLHEPLTPSLLSGGALVGAGALIVTVVEEWQRARAEGAST